MKSALESFFSTMTIDLKAEIKASVGTEIQQVERILKLKLSSIEQKVDGLRSSIEFTQNEMVEVKKDLADVEVRTSNTEMNNDDLKSKIIKNQSNICRVETSMIEKDRHFNVMKEDIKMLKQQNGELIQQQERTENYSRKNNILIEGIRESPHEGDRELRTHIGQVFDMLQLPVPDLVEYHRLKSGGYTKPIILKLVNFWDKKVILRYAYRLRGSSIYLKEDFSKVTLRKQSELRPFFNIAKKDSNSTRFIQDSFLYKGVMYNMENVDSIPLDMSEACCKTRNEVTVFSGTPCVLSNLHNIEIEVEGVRYNSSEQYYQTQKCIELHKPDVAHKVMQARSGYDAMLAGNQVKAPREWTYEQGVTIMNKAVTAKFGIQKCCDFLLRTQGIIAEATRNERWGIGISFNDPRAVQVKDWKGSNLMGEILTKLRNKLSDERREGGGFNSPSASSMVTG